MVVYMKCKLNYDGYDYGIYTDAQAKRNDETWVT